MADSIEQFYFQAVSLGVILFLGLGLNLTVIVTFIFSKPLRQTKHNILILQLMVCDMIYVLWVIPVTATNIICSHESCITALRTGTLCQTTGFLSVFQCTLASLTLAVIAIDRYVAVLHPHVYTCALTRSKCFVLLALCWIWAGLTALPPLLPTKSAFYTYETATRHCSPSFRTSCWFFWYAVGMGYGIPLPIMAFCYFKVARFLGRRRRKIFAAKKTALFHVNISIPYNEATGRETDTMNVSEVAMKNVKPTVTKASAVNVERQIAKRGALLIVAYFLCWGPYALSHACPVHLEGPDWLGVSAMYLVYSLTIINPIIYVFNNKQFRVELRKLFKRRR